MRLVQLNAWFLVCIFLVVLPQESLGQSENSRSDGSVDTSASKPQSPSAFRQETTIIRLIYRDPSPIENDEKALASDGEDFGQGPKPNCNSIVGRLKCVQWEMARQRAIKSRSDRNATSDQDADQTAKATIRVTPDYSQLYPNSSFNLFQLELTIEPPQLKIGDRVRPGIARQLQRELAKTVGRIREEVPRNLTNEERLDLLGGGQVRLPLANFYEDSIFSHLRLFKKPRASLLLKKRPIRNKPKLRFVTLEDDGRVAKLQKITIDQPFYVEAFYGLKLKGPPPPLVIEFPGFRLTLPLTQTPENKKIWRTAAVLPVLASDDFFSGLSQRSLEDQTESSESREPPPSEGPATNEVDNSGTNTVADGTETSEPQPEVPEDDTANAGLEPPPLGRRIVTEPVDNPLPSLPDLSKGPLGIDEFRTLKRPKGIVSSQPSTKRVPNDAPYKIRAGIDPSVRLTPGQTRGNLFGSGPSRPSPLAKLIKRLGADDERVKTLLTDGIQPSDEQAAAVILRQLDQIDEGTGADSEKISSPEAAK